MPLRDDHDAALARAEALERELARERDRRAEAEARAEQLEGEAQALEARIERLRDGDDAPPPERIPSRTLRAHRRRRRQADTDARELGVLWGLVVLAFAILIGALMAR